MRISNERKYVSVFVKSITTLRQPAAVRNLGVGIGIRIATGFDDLDSNRESDTDGVDRSSASVASSLGNRLSGAAVEIDQVGRDGLSSDLTHQYRDLPTMVS